MLRWLRKWVERGISNPAPDMMLACFLSMLEVRSLHAEQTFNDCDAKMTSILTKIQTGLEDLKRQSATISSFQEGNSVWIEAYRLERLLALIEPKDYLWGEVRSKVAEAKEEGLGATPELLDAVGTARSSLFDDSQSPPALRAGAEPLLRALLLEILEELHWGAERKYYSRHIRSCATRRIVASGIIAFLLFVIPYVILHVFHVFKIAQSVETWSFIPLYSAMTAGLFGAMFSRLLYLQMNWDALSVGGLKSSREFTSIFLRGCVGMTGAVIIFFFLKSNVIMGSLFPAFDKITVEYPPSDGRQLQLIYPNKDLALLIVWSFLAGFSERLVPSILRDTENTLATAESANRARAALAGEHRIATSTVTDGREREQLPV